MRESARKRGLFLGLLHHSSFLVQFSILTLFLAAAPALAADDDLIRLQPIDHWSTVFGGSEVEPQFEIVSDVPFGGSLKWTWSARGRTIASGEAAVAAAGNQPARVKIPLRIPPVNPGVIFETQLQLAAIGAGDRQPAATLTHPLTIFPRDPFYGRSEWLAGLSLSLFDPAGTTALVLTEAGVPFRRLRRLSSPRQVEDGLLLIGEGLLFSRSRRLDETLAAIAAGGVPVLCLAPADGMLVLPLQTGPEQAAPRRVALRRGDVITEHDKRLDARQWMSERRIAASRIGLQAERIGVVGVVSEEDGNGWPWIEIEFPQGARLVYCGFGIIKHWEEGPTPRFLLARMFERLTEESVDADDAQLSGRTQ